LYGTQAETTSAAQPIDLTSESVRMTVRPRVNGSVSGSEAEIEKHNALILLNMLDLA